MIIRRLDPSDAPQFRRLRLETLKNEPTAFGSSYGEQVRQPISFFEKRLEPTANHWSLGSFQGGKLVGALRLTREELKKECHKASIYGLYVTKSQRRKGIARALMKAALAQARRWRGLRQVRISVVASNGAAVSLYRREGFSEYGREKDSLCIDGRFYPEILMVKVLRRTSRSRAG